MFEPLIFTATLAGGILIFAIFVFNRLVHARNLVANAWSDIDVQLVRRHDLVPQLVACVNAYKNYEQSTLQAITQLRNSSEQATSIEHKANIEQAIASNVQNLVAVAEGYPQLQADKNFQQLSASLVKLEEHIQYARRFYNGAVKQLNTRIESFPDLVIAQLFTISTAEFFSANAQARDLPQISLD